MTARNPTPATPTQAAAAAARAALILLVAEGARDVGRSHGEGDVYFVNTSITRCNAQ